MPQDWFAQNAPKPQGGDWFAQHAPKPPEPKSKSVGGFIENIGSSAENTLSGMASMLNPANWDDIARGVGAQQKALNDQPLDPKGVGFDPKLTRIREQVGQLGDIAYEDPVGVALAFGAGTSPKTVAGLTTKAVSKGGKALVDLAPRAVQAAVKPTVAELRKQAGASMTGLQGQADKVTRALLRNRWTKPGQADEAIVQTEKQIQDVVQTNPNANVQPLLDTAERVPRYLKKLERSAGRQASPGADVSTIGGAREGVLEGPLAQTVRVEKPVPGLARTVEGPVGLQSEQATRMTPQRAMRANVTPQEGLEIARATGRWNNRKAWGELKGAEQESSKTVERAIRDSVKEAVPAAKPLLQKQGEALMLRPILDRMKLRQSNRDVVGLPAWVTAGPEIAAGKPPILSMLAQGLRNSQLPLGYALQDIGQFLGRNAGTAGEIGANANLAVLLSLLANQSPEP